MKKLVLCFFLASPVFTQTPAPGGEVVYPANFASVREAIGYVQTFNGILRFPCGTYTISEEIVIPRRITVEGGGSGNSSTAGHACTVLQKTADVAGIHVKSGASYTVLKGFQLTSTVRTGVADGIVVGDLDATNGVTGLEIRQVYIDSQKGNGINIRNGNSGVIDHVGVVGNGVNGILISSQNTIADNTNAWTLLSPGAGSNGLDGIRLDIASANTVIGMDSEGNGRYGIFADRPYNYIQGYAEANKANNVYTGISCYDCVTFVRDLENTTHQGNIYSWMFNMANNGTTPYLNPSTGRLGTRGGFSTPSISPKYGPVITIDSSLGNDFEVTATDGRDFTVSAPVNQAHSQRISISIRNSSGGSLGMVKWSPAYIMSPWVNPDNGSSRSVDFQFDEATSLWTEKARTYVDVGGSASRSDFVFSDIPPVVLRGQTKSGSKVAFVYPNMPIQTIWRTTCHAYTTTAGRTGTAQLSLHAQSSGSAGSSPASAGIDLKRLESTQVISDFDIIPVNTRDRHIDVQWDVNGNEGGAFSVECIMERLR